MPLFVPGVLHRGLSPVIAENVIEKQALAVKRFKR